MIKVACTPESRADIMQLVQVFRARVVDVAADSLIVETTGTEDKVDGLLQVLRPFGVLEMVRTGRVAMRRGSSVASLDAPRPSRQPPRPASSRAPDTRTRFDGHDVLRQGRRPLAHPRAAGRQSSDTARRGTRTR